MFTGCEPSGLGGSSLDLRSGGVLPRPASFLSIVCVEVRVSARRVDSTEETDRQDRSMDHGCNIEGRRPPWLCLFGREERTASDGSCILQSCRSR